MRTATVPIKTNIKSWIFVVCVTTILLAPGNIYTSAELYRIQKYLGRKCHLFADFLGPVCSGSLSPECCTLFALVDVCRTSCSGDLDSFNSQTLSSITKDPDFCSNVKNAGKELCYGSNSEHCSALRCLMNIVCFSATTCDSANTQPGIGALRTRHQSRTFELPELSACEATDLIGFDKRNLQVCPPVEITSGCSTMDLQYRTVDGSCNSLMHPDWGKSFTPPKRYLPSQYQDGVDAPRTISITGRTLMSPRYISSYVATKMATPAPFSAMVMAFGQYIDHDFTGFPVIKLNQSDTQCCKPDIDRTMLVENGGPCFPIKIEDDEDFFKGRKCMEFVRSNAAMDENENYLVPREQMNALTSFIDASSVYGSTEEVNEFLRTPDGRLKVGKNNMLPDGGKTNCKIVDPNTDYCLFAGDHRVNVFVGLGVFHTIFHRLHNQMVDRLAVINPHWNPEKLYQESRKINAALHQHTTYNEYLPAILNDDHLDKYKLRMGDFKYDPSLNPNMANSFSTAAFRFGHSQVNDYLKVGDDHIRTESTLMRPHLVLTRFDEVTHGLAAQPADAVDRFFSESMTDRLFEKNGSRRDGLDLVSLNIQRGRDHGLPPYNAYRKFCGLPPVRTFDSSVFQPRNDLNHVYIHVDDIDLFIGGVVERPLPGTILGPTFSCLVAQQFHDIKFGDRFFYETEHRREGFTEAQLLEIKRMKLSNIICATTGVAKIQLDIMRLPDFSKNREQSCKRMRDINLNHWREKP